MHGFRKECTCTPKYGNYASEKEGLRDGRVVVCRSGNGSTGGRIS